MKLKEIRQIHQGSPAYRAECFLRLGNEIGKVRTRSLSRKTVPSPLAADKVGVTSTFLNVLHGAKTTLDEAPRELRDIDILHCEHADIPLRVFKPRERKTVSAQAAKLFPGETKDDLALRQIGLGLSDSSGRARICAAYAYYQATGAKHVALPVLRSALTTKDPEEKEIAALALAKVDPDEVSQMVGSTADDQPVKAMRTKSPLLSMTLLVHGTFAKDSDWYHSRGDFHRNIKDQVYPDVYSGSDYFFWSGRYSLTEKGLREIWTTAAKKLVDWSNHHPAHLLRIISHSHGTNVVNLATQLGLKACTLIHLSPPIRPDVLPKIEPNVSSRRFFTFRSRVDLVVSIDGGAHDYRGTAAAKFEKRKIVANFGHSVTHEKKTWVSKKLPKLVTSVCPVS